jgi:hypothetical protein
MSQANVRSTEQLQDFRAALATFAEEALGALGTVDMEIRRTSRWLHDDLGVYWQGEIKRRREKLSIARAELSRRKMGQMYGRSTSHSEQKDAVEEAEKRLRDAEARAQKVKKWIPALQQAVMEYHSTSRRLEGLIGGEIPRAMVQLERVIDSLEAYLAVAVPSGGTVISPIGDRPHRTAGSGSAPVTAAAEPLEAQQVPEAAAPDVPAAAIEGSTAPARDSDSEQTA